jgi:hypothetical protein
MTDSVREYHATISTLLHEWRDKLAAGAQPTDDDLATVARSAPDMPDRAGLSEAGAQAYDDMRALVLHVPKPAGPEPAEAPPAARTTAASAVVRVLTDWTATLGADEPRPSDADIQAFAARRPLLPASDSLSEGGRARFNELRWLTTNYGTATSPWRFMPKSVRWTPGPKSDKPPGISLAKDRPAPPPAPKPSVNWRDELLKALLEWRDRERAKGHAEFDAFKAFNARDLVNSESTTPEQIARLLPPAMQEHAAAAAGIVAAHRPSADASDDAAEPEPDEPETPPSADNDLLALRFARYSHEETPALFTEEKGFAAGSLRLTAAPGRPGGRSWAAPEPAGEQIFRVVASHDSMPLGPDGLGVVELGRTRSDRFADDVAFGAAVRYYQVWANRGPTLEDAAAAQPVLVGAEIAVAPLTGLEVKAVEDAVMLRWNVPRPGASRVQVQRAQKGLGGGYGPGAVLRTQGSLEGHSDRDAAPGQDYLYRLQVEAPVSRGGAHRSHMLSQPVEIEGRLKVRLQAVPLQVRRGRPDSMGAPTVDLFWPVPGEGRRVLIYRSASRPPQNIVGEIDRRGQLEHAELGDIPFNNSEDAGDGLVCMRGVGLLPGHARMYFTPVTVLNDDDGQDGPAAVAPSTSFGNAPAVANPRLVERGFRQILTFEWPAGITDVSVFVTPEGQKPAEGDSPYKSCSREDYVKAGGAELKLQEYQEQGLLKPLDVHVVSSLWHNGQRESSDPVAVTYRPLRRLAYTVRRQGAVATVMVEPERPVLPGTTFGLVTHGERLPLHYADGKIVPGRALGGAGPPSKQLSVAPGPGGPNAPFGWSFDPGLLEKWTRLFVITGHADSDAYALFDPPVESLRSGGS